MFFCKSVSCTHYTYLSVFCISIASISLLFHSFLSSLYVVLFYSNFLHRVSSVVGCQRTPSPESCLLIELELFHELSITSEINTCMHTGKDVFFRFLNVFFSVCCTALLYWRCLCSHNVSGINTLDINYCRVGHLVGHLVGHKTATFPVQPKTSPISFSIVYQVLSVPTPVRNVNF